MRIFTLAFLLLSGLGSFAQPVSQRFEAVGFSQVRVEDAFWKPRLEKVATVTVPVCIEQTEVKTPRIRNFEVASGMREGQFQGIFYDDSDVFKALEAIAYALNIHPNAELEKKADEWIEKIAAAQRPDGYINTYYTLTGMDKRWTDMSMHEDYNGGHLIEAAAGGLQGVACHLRPLALNGGDQRFKPLAKRVVAALGVAVRLGARCLRRGLGGRSGRLALRIHGGGGTVEHPN